MIPYAPPKRENAPRSGALQASDTRVEPLSSGIPCVHHGVTLVRQTLISSNWPNMFRVERPTVPLVNSAS